LLQAHLFLFGSEIGAALFVSVPVSDAPLRGRCAQLLHSLSTSECVHLQPASVDVCSVCVDPLLHSWVLSRYCGTRLFNRGRSLETDDEAVAAAVDSAAGLCADPHSRPGAAPDSALSKVCQIMRAPTRFLLLVTGKQPASRPSSLHKPQVLLASLSRLGDPQGPRYVLRTLLSRNTEPSSPL
jgi:hypothetical protein